jgi:predicted amidophosphoribosyltransferase
LAALQDSWQDPRCVGCGRWLRHLGQHLCLSCYEDPPPWKHLWSLLPHPSQAHLVKRLEEAGYCGIPGWASLAALRLLRSEVPLPEAILTPPLSPLDRFRGHSQSLVQLSKSLGKLLVRPVYQLHPTKQLPSHLQKAAHCWLLSEPPSRQKASEWGWKPSTSAVRNLLCLQFPCSAE